MEKKDNVFTFGNALSLYYKDYETPLIINTDDINQFKRSDKFYVLGNEFNAEIKYPYFMSSLYCIESGDIVMVYNAVELIQRPRLIIKALMALRKKYGFSKLIYLPGIGDPYIIPVLVYAGADLFDDIYIKEESINNIKYTMMGKTKSSDNNINDNLKFANDIISLLRSAIKTGTLREFVEKFQYSSRAIEMLRIIDNDYFSDYSMVFPVYTPYIKANTIESLNRPDIVSYRNYIKNDYSKPDVENLLILPCSAKKPYSKSKSHKKILSRIEKYRKYIHELIVTSPVGLVPRELESMYPAAFYDIPVIGLWYEDEKKMINDLLKSYLLKNRYKNIVAYIDEDLNFIKSSGNIILIEGNILSEEKLSELESTLRDLTINSPKMDHLFNYKSMLSYQFGTWIKDYLDDIKISRSYNMDMVTRNGRALFVFNEKLGRFTINRNGACIFLNAGKKIVYIDDFKPTSYVFNAGIKDATDDIKPGDEVIIVHNNEIRGVGTALISYRAMIDLDHGAGVKVR
ncbi:DUF5591 domain-containing protein [Picrophilus oshimae]|uniref:tRNA-archaeosine synthase n=1 Tax=Picrophilus torridus (strain ATCC 700027 / DSM 9790 / JCM 10055 / NBRC 100828 / KAW 2/3) TaxID=1122961 RepID=A0A8G2FVS2_PICTO|nr:DUF5591 domain-containing protein [Picrophilus oshimae]SMD30383.1 tRNA-archaeosine synthase [Picrophilus oshimae DSM 9789]